MSWPPENLSELLTRSAEILHAAGASDVYVFGSAATGRMHAHSDVDLAVSGLPPKIFFRTMSRINMLFEGWVELVDLDVNTPFTTYLKSKEGCLKRVA